LERGKGSHNFGQLHKKSSLPSSLQSSCDILNEAKLITVYDDAQTKGSSRALEQDSLNSIVSTEHDVHQKTTLNLARED